MIFASTIWRSIAIIFACAFEASPGLAANRGVINFQIENDFFAGAGDRHYTNGLGISYFTPPSEQPHIFSGLEKKLRNLERAQRLFDLGDMRFSFGLGQNMYTPEDIKKSNPATDDRPYSGWLYGSVGVVSQKCVEKSGAGAGAGAEQTCLLKNLELELGMVGPASFAKQVQGEWHEFIKIPKAQGWRHQLKNEPGAVLFYEQKYRNLENNAASELDSDFTPHWGFALGNIFTYGAAGATLRFGEGLQKDYGPPRIRPSLPGSGFFETGDHGFSWYVFAGVEGRVVARNIFLDGNSFADSRNVNSKPLVGDLQGGLVVTVDRVRLSFTHVLRSEEFESQDKPDIFGAVALSISY